MHKSIIENSNERYMQMHDLEKSGIIFENPYKHAYDNVCFELLQLLITVEKIKASKATLDALEDLVSLHTFLSEQDNIKNYLQSFPYFSKAREAGDILATVCRVLDKKKQPTFNDFTIEANLNVHQHEKPYNGTRRKSDDDRWNDFWLRLAPENVNKHGYKFNSLKVSALGYSHLNIFFAYKSAQDVLRVTEKLQSIDEIAIVSSVIKKYADEMKVDSSTLLDKAKRSLHMTHQINQKICLSFSKRFFELTKPVKTLFHIDKAPFDRYYPEIKIEQEEYNDTFFSQKEVGEVVTMKLPRKVFEASMDTGTESLVNRAILNCIWDKVEGKNSSSFINNVDDSYYLETLSDYSYWASNQGYTLLDIELNKGRKLTMPSIMRGMRFSYWFYEKKNSCEERLNIGDAVKLYVKEKELDFKDSATTVKFSFEAIKRVGKTELGPLVRKQLMWRLNNDLASIMYAFEPLNSKLYQQLKMASDRLIEIVGPQAYPENYEQLVRWITGIEKSLETHDEIKYLASEFDFSCSYSDVRSLKLLRNDLLEVIKHKQELNILMSE